MEEFKARLAVSEAKNAALTHSKALAEQTAAALLDQLQRASEDHNAELTRLQNLSTQTGEPLLSLERLRWDPLYKKKVHLLTGFSSIEFLDALFDWVMAYTKGVLPRFYQSPMLKDTKEDEDACLGVDGKTMSRTPIDMHKNYMFFTLYVIRTGPSAMERTGLLFGFRTHQHGMGWYVSWLRLLKIVCARHFPQPTREIIIASSPKKMLDKYNSNLMGVIDCTEQKMQTPYEKMAQRATWRSIRATTPTSFLLSSLLLVSPCMCPLPSRVGSPMFRSAVRAHITVKEVDEETSDDDIDAYPYITRPIGTHRPQIRKTRKRTVVLEKCII